MLADKEFLDSVLAFIGERLKRRIDCLLIGGNAMVYYGLRGFTKDVDLVFFKSQDVSTILNILKTHPLYKGATTSREIPYKMREELAEDKPIFLAGKDIPRFDIFYKKIFSIDAEILAKHCKRNMLFDLLNIKIAEPEDLIILKAATERPRDKEDIALLVKELEIDWAKLGDYLSEVAKDNNRIALYVVDTLLKVKSIPRATLDKLARGLRV